MRAMKKKRKTVIKTIILLCATGVFIHSAVNVKKYYCGTTSSISKVGELVFIDSSTTKPITIIDIELANNDIDRAKGLMFRQHMNENEGMLFIMKDYEPQSFWMKNTYISLDIIYVDSDFNIVKIYRSTKPFSERPLNSFKSSKYVVEVNSGFCVRHGITIGSKIKYNLF